MPHTIPQKLLYPSVAHPPAMTRHSLKAGSAFQSVLAWLGYEADARSLTYLSLILFSGSIINPFGQTMHQQEVLIAPAHGRSRAALSGIVRN